MKILGQKKVHQVFNASIISGPETLVMPNLVDYKDSIEFVLIQETRLKEKAEKVAAYVKNLGFKTHEIWVDSQLDLKATKRLAQFWKDNPPDIIHAHAQKASFYTVFAQRLPGFRKPISKRPKLVNTNHSVRLNSVSKKLRFYETVYQRLVMPYFNLTSVVCSTDAQILIQNDVCTDRVRVHLNGVDRKKITWEQRPEHREKVRRSWGVPESVVRDGIVFGVVARVSREKRYDRIIHAFAKAIRMDPKTPMHLVCVGIGPLEESLKKQCQELGIQDRVHWLGYRSDAAYEMVAMDAVLSWSDSEGLPINLIESAWVATPVIVHGVDGILELVTPDTGILIQSPMTLQMGAESLVRFAQDPVMQEKLGRGFQNRVEKEFSSTALGVMGVGLTPKTSYIHAETAEDWKGALLRLPKTAAPLKEMGERAFLAAKNQFSRQSVQLCIQKALSEL